MKKKILATMPILLILIVGFLVAPTRALEIGSDAVAISDIIITESDTNAEVGVNANANAKVNAEKKPYRTSLEEETSAEAETRSEVESDKEKQEIRNELELDAKDKTEIRLMFERFRDKVLEIAFDIRLSLALSNEERVDLIKKRNEVLKERQMEWVELKSKIMSDLETEATAEEKQDIIAEIQTSHDAIVEKRLELIDDLNRIKITSSTETEIESEASTETST